MKGNRLKNSVIVLFAIALLSFIYLYIQQRNENIRLEEKISQLPPELTKQDTLDILKRVVLDTILLRRNKIDTTKRLYIHKYPYLLSNIPGFKAYGREVFCYHSNSFEVKQNTFCFLMFDLERDNTVKIQFTLGPETSKTTGFVALKKEKEWKVTRYLMLPYSN